MGNIRVGAKNKYSSQDRIQHRPCQNRKIHTKQVFLDGSWPLTQANSPGHVGIFYINKLNGGAGLAQPEGNKARFEWIRAAQHVDILYTFSTCNTPS